MAISTFIDRIGLELEGVWCLTEGFQGKIVRDEGIHIVKDTSVKVSTKSLDKYTGDKTKYNYTRNQLEGVWRSGEIVSAPLSSLDEGSNFIRKYWPDFVDSSCGFHIHLSFLDHSYYSCLMDESFNNYYKETLRKFSEDERLNRTFKRRFEGKNTFCRDDFVPNKQAYQTRKYEGGDQGSKDNPRYAALNFCFSIHGTMECRVFSSNMGVNKAVLGYLWFVKMVNSYLEKYYPDFIKREHAKEVEIDLEEGVIIDLNRKPIIKSAPKRENNEEIINFMKKNFKSFFMDLTKLSEDDTVSKIEQLEQQVNAENDFEAHMVKVAMEQQVQEVASHQAVNMNIVHKKKKTKVSPNNTAATIAD